MCNNSLAAPQRKFENSILPLKKPTSLISILGRLAIARSSVTKLIGLHKHWAWFFVSIYRKEDVLCQLKIRGASEKFKNQPRPLLRPRSVNFRQHFRNLSDKKWGIFYSFLRLSSSAPDPNPDPDPPDPRASRARLPYSMKSSTGSALSKLLIPVSGHPCSGQLSVSDVRLRLSHTIHNTEGGKRVHSVVSNTTRVVADTGKVVAGGIGAAKVSLSLSILCRFTGRICVSRLKFCLLRDAKSMFLIGNSRRIKAFY